MHITQFTERKIIKIMRKRIGNDFLFYWIIKENDIVINPNDVIDFKTTIRHRRTGSEIVAEFDVVNSSPIIKCENLLYLGVYDLIATWKTVDYSFEDDFRNSSADVQAFEIVSSSSSECETDLTVTSEIAIGFEGADAFEVWVKNGNEGKTYEDYIAFLQKPATDAAVLADAATENANAAATLANTKAGLANDAAVLATDKASLADSKATLANDKATLAQSAADNADEKAAEVTASVLSAGQLGPIKPTDAAPTPARNGNYTFSIGGNKPAWLTAEAGVTTVKAGDGVAVVYTEPSSYSYTHVNVSSDFITIMEIEQARSQSASKVPSSKLLDDEFKEKVIPSVHTINLYNEQEVIPAQGIDSSGNIRTDGIYVDWKTSGLIPVLPADSVYITCLVAYRSTGYAWLDSNRQKVGYGTDIYNTVLTAPANSAYLIFNVAAYGSNNSRDVMVIKGTSAQPYVPYRQLKQNQIENLVALSSDIDSLSSAVDSLSANFQEDVIEKGITISDETVTLGYAWTATVGKLPTMLSVGNVNYKYITFQIPANCLKITIEHTVLTAGLIEYILLDSNLKTVQVITGIDGAVTSIIEEFSTATHIGFNARTSVGYSIIATVNETVSQVILGEESVDNENIKQNSITLDKIKEGIRISSLNGKKWAVIGDSFTDGGYGATPIPPEAIIQEGLYSGKTKTYGWLIGNRNNMVIQHMALGGRTMAMPADDTFTNAFSNAGSSVANSNYTQIASDVDFITIYLGINDAHHAGIGDDEEPTEGYIPIGTINDTTAASYYGAFNIVMEYLRTNHPFAKIGLIAPNGTGVYDYPSAVIAIAKKWGVPYIDINGNQSTPMMLRSANPDASLTAINLVTDAQIIGGGNYHPNWQAQEFMSEFLEEWLKKL